MASFPLAASTNLPDGVLHHCFAFPSAFPAASRAFLEADARFRARVSAFIERGTDVNVVLDLIDAGLVPMPLWEGDCTSRLETIADIPRGKAIYWFERTDLARAKQVLGDVVCLRGNHEDALLKDSIYDEIAVWFRSRLDRRGEGSAP